MNEQEAQLFAMRGVVYSAGPDDRKRIEDSAEEVRAVMRRVGPELALIAVGLVALELQVQGEKFFKS